MSDIIVTDAHKLVSNSSVFVSLFELTMNSITYYFHSENTEDDIVFDGNTYVVFPMHIEGIESNADGASNRPHLTIANVNSLLDTNTKTEIGIPADFVLEDLVGSRITRRQTMQKYTGVGVTAYEFPVDVYIIDRIASRNQLIVQLELASPFDFGGARVPARVVVGKYCPWVYKGYSISETDVRSACFWKDENQVTQISGSSFSFFYTIDDEPLLKETITEITTASSWNSASSYSVEQIVSNNGLYWIAKAGTNLNNEPVEGSIFWKLARTFSVWSTDGTKSYSVDTLDPRKSSYVYHNNTVWRALKDHTRDTSFPPSANSNYWTAGDVCGKLLNSCKVRYQAIPAALGQGNNAVPKVGSFDTQEVLPFGGFPGTRKFR